VKKLAIALLFLSLSIPATSLPRHPGKSEQRKASHRIEFTVPEDSLTDEQLFPSADGKGACSASALGPHALLTAQHCDVGEEYLTVDLELSPRKIVGRITDGEDHIIFLVNGSKFKATMAAEYDPTTYALPTVGEKVFLFGDGRAMYPPQYRNGYYTGTAKIEDGDASKDPDVFLFDLNIIPGDSGSAVYGDGGKLVTLITYSMGGKFAGCYKMAFTEAQIAQAEAF